MLDFNVKRVSEHWFVVNMYSRRLLLHLYLYSLNCATLFQQTNKALQVHQTSHESPAWSMRIVDERLGGTFEVCFMMWVYSLMHAVDMCVMTRIVAPMHAMCQHLCLAVFGDFRKKKPKHTWLYEGISPLLFGLRTWSKRQKSQKVF